VKSKLLLGSGAVLVAALIFLAAAPEKKPDPAEAARLNNLGCAYMNQQLFEKGLKNFQDAAVLDPARVIEVARGVEGVRDVHRVRSRGVHHAVELDLHLQVGSEMSVRSAHALAREIEAQLRVKFPELSDVVIHIEPCPVVVGAAAPV